MTTRTFAWLVFVGLALLSRPAAAASIAIDNFDFEDVQISGGKSLNVADVPGWTRTGAAGDAAIWEVGYSDPSGSVTVAGHANQFVTMGGGYGPSGATSWEQLLTGFVVGQSYTLDFLMASEAFNGPFTFPDASTMTLSASLIGVATISQNFTSTNGVGNYWRDWEAKSLMFTADAASLNLKFTYSGPYDVGLDYVRIASNASTVPEPGTLSLFGVGGATALARWRRRRLA